MKLEDLKHVSESTRQRNPALFGVGGLRSPNHKSNTLHEAKKANRAQASRKSRVGKGIGPILRVTIVVCRNKITDSDGAEQLPTKWLRDAIAKSFDLDDADSIIQWQYSNLLTRGQPGVIVMIERVNL